MNKEHFLFLIFTCFLLFTIIMEILNDKHETSTSSLLVDAVLAYLILSMYFKTNKPIYLAPILMFIFCLIGKYTKFFRNKLYNWGILNGMYFSTLGMMLFS